MESKSCKNWQEILNFFGAASSFLPISLGKAENGCLPPAAMLN
jgi:hypothetical protein